jgi:hypothetical protein
VIFALQEYKFEFVMTEEKPSFNASVGPFSTDLVALWGWLKQRGKTDRVAVAAQRFLKLFEDHGVAVTQIQHFLPQLTLDKIQKPEALLSMLTPDMLEQAAQLFKVRRTWLEGVDNQIYDCAFCYQMPGIFFEELATVPRTNEYMPVRGLFCTGTLDYRNPKSQPIALVLIEKIRELGNTEIFRYRVFHDDWDWNYPNSRIQLKAIVRVMEQLHRGPVPLDLVKPAIVEQVQEGRLIPRPYLRRAPTSDPSLEDYACTKQEHAKAKECDELPDVQRYIKKENLLAIAKQKLKIAS